jgi:hypothetical protein
MIAHASAKAPQRRKDAFDFSQELAAFEKSLLELLREQVRMARESVLSPENVQAYNHGSRWASLSSNRAERVSTFKEHSNMVEIPWRHLVEHDLSAIPRYVGEMVTGIHKEFMEFLYMTVHEACEESGNTVSAREAGSPAVAFLQALKTIQFSVNRQGKVTRPEFHAGTEAFEALKKNIEGQGEEFRREVERITSEKEREALQREEARKQRFKPLR